MTEAPTTGLEVRLVSRPKGFPTEDNFEVVSAPVPALAPGQVLVRNRFMSVDPAMRGRMDDVPSYVAPFELGAALDGGAVGEVIASTAEDLKPGDCVLHRLGWREYAVLEARHAGKVDPERAPLSAYLGVLGMPGLTAYAGLLEVAEFKAGDTVFVSGAAGAVGSVVGQIARLRGAGRVIGSAGSAAKVKHVVDELGFDAAFDYHDGPVREQLKQHAPDGIDVYFDNVGGEHLEAALARMNLHGRVAVCGMISLYNATEPSPAPHNLVELIRKRITMRGFLVLDFAHLRDQFFTEVGGWIADGSLRYDETVVDGLAQAPEAFLGLLRGRNTGKMLVRIS
jgi:NADPH-dependent curcumin reductase CurA